jgi:hypothetical protein
MFYLLETLRAILPTIKTNNMEKIYYLGYWIFKIGDEWITSIDDSSHKSLTSAKAHTDYLLN